MLLYIYPDACSLADHIALIEAGLPYQLMAIDHHKRLENGQDYATINPRGLVPSLRVEDGAILTETLAILAFIAERSGALLPDGAFGRWRALEALSFMTTTIHGGLAPFFKKATEAETVKAGETVRRGFGVLDAQMGEKPFLLGERMSIADPYLYWTLRAASRFGIVMPRSLQAFFERMNREPSVVRALVEEGLSAA